MTAKHTLHSKTPSVAIIDNQGRTVREILHHRHPDTPDITDERITRYTFDDTRRLQTSIDPRLYEYKQADTTVKPNITTQVSLSGVTLRSESVDAGITIALNDIAGRPVFSIDANRVIRRWQYENNTLPGRPLSMTEQPEAQPIRITERLIWASNGQEEKALNLAGLCIRHYSTTGFSQIDSMALAETPLSITQQHLREGQEADWQGDDESAWKDRLDSDVFTTQTTADATGALLIQTDPKGNQQRQDYNIVGQLKSSWLKLKGLTEQIIVKSLTWSASGQILREEHGNGVVTTYSYEPETQRLIGIRTERPQGHALGARILQDLRYEYDPVGNVLQVTNDAESTRFWRNQKVVPENTYRYDSLYQLVSATGREIADIPQQRASVTAASIPLSTDHNAFTAYTRTYLYDRANNLTQIRHHAPATNNNYTIAMTVSDRSNRAVLSTLTENPDQVDSLFDAAGHQLQMQPGQQLTWNSRGELLQVSPVARVNALSDDESYRYDSDGTRTRKVRVQRTRGSTVTQQVIYLPGLELHMKQNGDTVKERLQVISVREAGSAQLRILHWDIGKPEEMVNNQLRYSYGNLTNSIGLEIDGEGSLISQEEYYPYGGTSVWMARNHIEANYKTIRYSGKEQDATGLYYYGFRYYQPWAGRWLSADPAGAVDGLNLFRMVRNNPVNSIDEDGRATTVLGSVISFIGEIINNGISLPSFSSPSFSLPSFSLPSFSFSDFSPVGLLRRVVGYAVTKLYRRGWKKGVNYLLSKADNDAQKIKYMRWIKAVGIGTSVAVAIATTLATAGVALPVIAGVTAIAALAGGATGYFGSEISSAASSLTSKLPLSTRSKSRVNAQIGNTLNGGSMQTAVSAGIVNEGNDRVLKKLNKSSEVREESGLQIGTAAGEFNQLNGGETKAGMEYPAPLGASVASWFATKKEDLKDVGNIAALGAKEGYDAGKKWGNTGPVSKIALGVVNFGLANTLGVQIPNSNSVALAAATVQSSGRATERVISNRTNNYNMLRNAVPQLD
nr:RHS repeat domain-containing protein [Xenorhabdus ishibashii]